MKVPDLEARINAAYRRLTHAPKEKREFCWRRMKRLVEKRSPQQIDAMERRMGIGPDA